MFIVSTIVPSGRMLATPTDSAPCRDAEADAVSDDGGDIGEVAVDDEAADTDCAGVSVFEQAMIVSTVTGTQVRMRPIVSRDRSRSDQGARAPL
jgi:hypothetical protein